MIHKDDHKEEMALIAKRVIQRCHLYLKESSTEQEIYRSLGKIKKVFVGGRVYVAKIPKAGASRKL